MHKSVLIKVAVVSLVVSQPVFSANLNIDPVDLVKEVHTEAKESARKFDILKVNMAKRYRDQMRELESLEKDSVSAIKSARSEAERNALREAFLDKKEELINDMSADVNLVQERIDEVAQSLTGSVTGYDQAEGVLDNAANAGGKLEGIKDAGKSAQRNLQTLKEDYDAISDKTSVRAMEVEDKMFDEMAKLQETIQDYQIEKQFAKRFEVMGERVKQFKGQVAQIRRYAQQLKLKYRYNDRVLHNLKREIKMQRSMLALSDGFGELTALNDAGKALDDVVRTTVSMGRSAELIPELGPIDLPEVTGDGIFSMDEVLNFKFD